MANKTIHIALFQTLGDVLMATPIVRAIKEKNPQDNISFYTQKQYAEIFRNNPDVNKIYEANNYEDFYKLLYYNKMAGDIVVPLGMTGQYETLWHHTNRNLWMGDWYASKVPKELGIEVPLKNKHIVFNAHGTINDTDLLLKLGQLGIGNANPLWFSNNLIIVHTTSRLESKDWPIENWRKLLEMFNHTELKFIQIGSKEDKTIFTSPISNKYDWVYHLDLSLAETAKLIQKCKFYIGIDSGPAYIAEAMNKPSFIIMGASSGIPGEHHTWVGPQADCITYIEPPRYDNPNCYPQECISHCALGIDKHCINQVTPEIVFQTIQKKLKYE